MTTAQLNKVANASVASNIERFQFDVEVSNGRSSRISTYTGSVVGAKRFAVQLAQDAKYAQLSKQNILVVEIN